MSPDDAEWSDAANWYLGRQLYFAPRDSRVFVPKAHGPDRLDSQTLNFARAQSWLIFAMLLAPPVAVLVTVNAAGLRRFGRHLIETLGGATTITLGLFAVSFVYYAIMRFIDKRAESETMKRWVNAGSDRYFAQQKTPLDQAKKTVGEVLTSRERAD